jgi:tetratricopeptide (TPR) repeat protein
MNQGTGNAVTSAAGMESLLAGRYKKAASVYAELVAKNQSDIGIKLESLCVSSARGNVAQVRQALETYQGIDLSSEQRARYLTASAYTQIHEGRSGIGVQLLLEAARLDPSFALASLSLGRHFLFAAEDYVLARQYLEGAARLAPSAEGTLLGLVSLGAEMGDYAQSREAAVKVTQAHRRSLRGWLSFLSSSLLIGSLLSRLAMLVFLGIAFLPWGGPAMGIAALILAGASLRSLRRISPRLALAPSIALGLFMVAYFVRLIVYGRLYP